MWNLSNQILRFASCCVVGGNWRICDVTALWRISVSPCSEVGHGHTYFVKIVRHLAVAAIPLGDRSIVLDARFVAAVEAFQGLRTEERSHRFRAWRVEEDMGMISRFSIEVRSVLSTNSAGLAIFPAAQATAASGRMIGPHCYFRTWR